MSTPASPTIWLLRAGGKRNLSLIPNSLEYFQTHFRKEPMASDWTPPSFDILGKSKKLRDFVGLMISAPVVSDRVRRILEPLCDGDVEFLPLQEIMGKRYFAMNVLRVEDVLDLARCEFTSIATTKQIISIQKFAFRAELSSSLPPIFKTPQDTGDIFVTESFVDVALANRFTGLALANPVQNNFAKILRGESLNAVPGIIE